jgi:hypothetical protein
MQLRVSEFLDFDDDLNDSTAVEEADDVAGREACQSQPIQKYTTSFMSIGFHRLSPAVASYAMRR